MNMKNMFKIHLSSLKCANVWEIKCYVVFTR